MECAFTSPVIIGDVLYAVCYVCICSVYGVVFLGAMYMLATPTYHRTSIQLHTLIYLKQHTGPLDVSREGGARWKVCLEWLP